MRGLAVLAAAAMALAVAGEPGEGTTPCELRLKNGSIVRGELVSPREIRLDRGEDAKTFRVEDLLQVTPVRPNRKPEKGRRKAGPARRDTVVGRQGTFEGEMQPPGPWVVETGFGTLTIPHEDVVSAGFFGASIVIDFGDSVPRGAATLGKGRWTADGTSLRVDPAGKGDALLLPVPVTGDYVIEADVRCDGWVALLFNSDEKPGPAGHPSIGALWLTPGTAGICSPPDWLNFFVQRWTVPTREGQTLHVRLAVSGKRATVSLDGEVVGEAEVAVEGRKFGFGGWSKPAHFENVRISR